MKEETTLFTIEYMFYQAVHCGTQRSASCIMAAFAVHCQEEHEEETDPQLL